MTPRLLATVLALGSFPLLAQTHDPASAGVVHTSDIGFSYSIPADWEVVDTKPTLPAVQAEVAKTAKNEDEKKGIGCVQVALTARHRGSLLGGRGCCASIRLLWNDHDCEGPAQFWFWSRGRD